MIRLEMKNYNTILTEKQQKYRLDHLEKLINMNFFQMKQYYHPIKEQVKLTYSYLGKAFEKQTKAIDVPEEKQMKAQEDSKKQLGNLDNKKQLGNN